MWPNCAELFELIMTFAVLLELRRLMRFGNDFAVTRAESGPPEFRRLGAAWRRRKYAFRGVVRNSLSVLFHVYSLYLHLFIIDVEHARYRS